MEFRDQASGTDVDPTADATLSIADVEPTGQSEDTGDSASSTIATEADVAGVTDKIGPDLDATLTVAGNPDGPAALPDHGTLLHRLLEELEHVEHMGKSEIAAVLDKFRALL
ncbi:hypothetical protein [Pandoraea anhela]|uniref:Uncharacterized protein n=1 Tax=Pandoraea anhela TaxID=2508295 RepID=A0A5E4Z1L0_9BURK|nr:hypothetical protein [Pandoraea anhela]VVE54538.1 hypothetical protein PAN31108_04938 [Pandoraea anhela]